MTMDAQGSDTQARFRVIRSADGSSGVQACTVLAPGETLATFTIAALVPQPTRYSIQLGVALHALVEPEALRFLNHSCDPNLALDASSRALKAIRHIEPGQELTFFYPSTEWEMAEPFLCQCGAPRCFGRVAGAAHLPTESLTTYQLADHIRLLLEQGGAKPDAPGEPLEQGLARA